MFGQNEIVGKKFFAELPDNTLMVTSMFETLQGEGPFSGRRAYFIRLAKCNLNCSFCFPLDTPIEKLNGEIIKVENLRVGDKLPTFKHEGPKLDYGMTTVDSIMLRLVSGDTLVEFTYEDEAGKQHNLRCTEDHRFYCALAEYPDTYIWKVAKALRTGDKIISHDGITAKTVEVIAVNRFEESEDVTVVSFKCKPHDRYFVNGENGILAHNCDTYFDSGDEMRFDDILERMRVDMGAESLDDLEAKLKDTVVVFTGGEPLLQNNLTAFIEYMELQFPRVKMQIESNGIPIFQQPSYGDLTFVISPKALEGKTGQRYLKPHKDNLKHADALKFVMEADPESIYSSIPDWALELKAETGIPIYISPMNRYNRLPEKSNGDLSARSGKDEVISFWEPGLLDMETNRINHEYAARYCMKNNCIFNLQAHLYAGLA